MGELVRLMSNYHPDSASAVDHVCCMELYPLANNTLCVRASSPRCPWRFSDIGMGKISSLQVQVSLHTSFPVSLADWSHSQGDLGSRHRVQHWAFPSALLLVHFSVTDSIPLSVLRWFHFLSSPRGSHLLVLVSVLRLLMLRQSPGGLNHGASDTLWYINPPRWALETRFPLSQLSYPKP